MRSPRSFRTAYVISNRISIVISIVKASEYVMICDKKQLPYWKLSPSNEIKFVFNRGVNWYFLHSWWILEKFLSQLFFLSDWYQPQVKRVRTFGTCHSHIIINVIIPVSLTLFRLLFNCSIQSEVVGRHGFVKDPRTSEKCAVSAARGNARRVYG